MLWVEEVEVVGGDGNESDEVDKKEEGKNRQQRKLLCL